FDTWHYYLLQGLSQSRDARVAEIAAKSLKEVDYHLRRSGDWVITLGDGTDESHRRMQDAIDDLWMYTGELFENDAVDQALANDGTTVDLAALHGPWVAHVS